MLCYETQQGILTIRVAGDPALIERYALFSSINRDRSIPSRVMLLVDALDAAVELPTVNAAVAHLQIMVERLSPKLAPICAILARRNDQLMAQNFRRAAAEFGLFVGIFHDEPSARAWLATQRNTDTAK